MTDSAGLKRPSVVQAWSRARIFFRKEVFVSLSIRPCGLALFFFASLGSYAQQIPKDPVLSAMQQELTRSFENLKKTPVPPYFLSYQLTDNRSVDISASSGALMGSSDTTTRLLDLDLRVGDYSLDNTHSLRDGSPEMNFGDQMDRQRIPLDNDPDALRVALWQETERKYRSAVQRFQKVKANVQVKIEAEDRSGDFSHEPADTYVEPPASFSFDSGAWEQKLRKFTAAFAGHKEIVGNSAQVDAEIETRRYVNSDGSVIETSTPYYRIVITATAKANDGMELPLYETYMSFRPNGLPDDSTISSCRDVPARSSSMRYLAIGWKASAKRTRTKHRHSRGESIKQYFPIFCLSFQTRD
jgi:TldD protein